MKITTLTSEQELRLKATYEEWLNIGRGCEPINLTEATAVVNEFYARLGKPAPAIFVFSSPMMCVLGWAALRTLADEAAKRPKGLTAGRDAASQLQSQLQSQLGSQLRSQLGSQLRSQLGSQLRSQLQSQLGSQLGSQLWSQLWSQLGSQLWSQLWSQLQSQLWSQLRSQLWSQLQSQLWSQLRSQLRSQLQSQLGSQLGSQLWSQLQSQLGSQLQSQLYNYCGGAHWCYWEVFYKFCSDIGVKYLHEHQALLDLWIRQSRALHWWFPYDGIVLLSQRHTVCATDSEGRLHSESGLACGYSDGWGVFAWHGVIVPQQVIEAPETLSIEQIHKEPNAEVRRVMLERFGAERFCREAKCSVVHKDTLNTNLPLIPQSEEIEPGKRLVVDFAPGIEHAELLRSELLDAAGQQVQFVHVKCPSTGREYFLRVSPECRRAYEAVASTFGMTEEQYRNGSYIRQGDVMIRALSGGNQQQLHS